MLPIFSTAIADMQHANAAEDMKSLFELKPVDITERRESPAPETSRGLQIMLEMIGFDIYLLKFDHML